MMAVVGSDTCKLLVFGLVILFSHVVGSSESGLTTRQFRGLPSFQGVQCTGRSLPPGTDLYALALYDLHSHRPLSLADLAKRHCSTGEEYVSCEIDPRDAKRSRLTVLLVDLAEGRTRAFGCNASVLTSGGRFRVVTWSIVVRGRDRE